MTDESKGVRGRSKLFTSLTSVLLVAGLGVTLATTEAQADGKDRIYDILRKLVVKKVKVENVRKHQAAWQEIADRNDNIRFSGTAGYDESVDYVEQQLKRKGFKVQRQAFEYLSSRTLGPSDLEQTAPGSVIYVEDTDFNLMSQTDSGSPEALVAGVDLFIDPDETSERAPANSTSGCEPEDFTGFPAGYIALVQRGACTFQLKAENAANAGAVGAIIFNQGNSEDRKGLINGTLSADYSGGIPVFFATFDRGVEWAGTDGLVLKMFANVFRGFVTTENVIADPYPWPHLKDKPVIVMGAHLDSVEEGPGIQDNGSGSGAILEIARQVGPLSFFLKNRIRFAWWAAEESGLVGSQYYVDNLSPEELAEIAANLNYDMIGSPNFVPFVYDGDGSDTDPAGPPGSEILEQLFNDAIEARGYIPKPTQFSGRSDYGPFIQVGIPAGGLFTGAEGIKTEEEEEIYGGTAGDQYDPCYHLACDTFDNISLEALELNSKVAADVMLQVAFMKLPLAPPAAAVASLSVQSLSASAAQRYDFEFLGKKFRK